MEDSHLVNKNNSKTIHLIEENTKVIDLITPIKHWDTNSLINILPDHIINKIKATTPFLNLNDRITWRFMSHGEYSIKTATCATILRSHHT